MSPSENLTNALICLPDLTHFTEFMALSDEKNNHEIISNILKQIIDSNSIGFELAEIEGDAIFFYMRENSFPQLSAIIEQCGNFYTGFTALLRTLNREQFFFNRNGKKEYKLGLKIILHSGPIGMLNIRHILKPIGQTVVEAHRLMKNSIPFEEYLLVTENVMAAFGERLDEACPGAEVLNGEDAYDHLGSIKYQYVDLKSFLPGKQQKGDKS